MPTKTWALVLAALGLTLAIGIGGTAQEPKDLPPTPPVNQPKGTGEVIGETVDGVVKSLTRGARATAESLQEQYQQAKTTVHSMNTQARVYGRLHWDKSLEDARIDVEVKEGIAILRGAVKTLRAKAKALELTRDTVGISRVEDQLTIESVSPAESLERPRP